MQKVKNFVSLHYKNLTLGFLVAMAGTLVGSVLVARASIPASDGTISGCRNNTTTMLRVIDATTSACDTNESALNWDQKGVKAYAYVTYNNIGAVSSLDGDRSYNISNFQYSTPLLNARQFCFTVNGTPKNVSVLVSNDPASYTISGVGIKDANGWTNTTNNTCDTQSPGSNVFVRLMSYSTSFFVTIH